MKPILLALLAAVVAQSAFAELNPNAVQQKMFFRSFVQDHANCGFRIENGEVAWDPGVASSPASFCPDAFAWVGFAKAVRGEFWNWGIDETTWPETPKPL